MRKLPQAVTLLALIDAVITSDVTPIRQPRAPAGIIVPVSLSGTTSTPSPSPPTTASTSEPASAAQPPLDNDDRAPFLFNGHIDKVTIRYTSPGQAHSGNAADTYAAARGRFSGRGR